VNPIYIAFESIPSMILSVLIPVKNMGESVFRSLKSAHINLQHSSFQYEIIISENASTDNTLKEIKRFLGDKSYGDKCQIRLIENSKDIGQSENYKLLLNESKGKYIFYLAADDYLDDAALNNAVKFLDANNDYSACGFNSIFIKNNYTTNDRQSKKLDKSMNQRLLNACLFPGANSIYYSVKRRDILEKWESLGINKKLLGYDQIETFYFLTQGRIKNIDDKIYRKIGGSGFPKEVRAKFKNQFLLNYIPKPLFLLHILLIINTQSRLVCVLPLIFWWMRLIIAPIRHYFNEKKYQQ